MYVCVYVCVCVCVYVCVCVCACALISGLGNHVHIDVLSTPFLQYTLSLEGSLVNADDNHCSLPLSHRQDTANKLNLNWPYCGRV